MSAHRNETPIGGPPPRLPALCAKLVALYVICPLLFPPHPSLPFSPRILESVYIRYPIVLPRVIVARDINADIRRGLANMSHRGAFLRAFTSVNLCDTALRTRWERLIN